LKNPGQNDLSDFSMLDLFRVELEIHSRALETGLSDIVSRQSPEEIEPLMRAAHSIKGAARIVGLDLIVSLSHAMEDFFSKAQHGEIQISTDQIKVLNKSNGIFLHLATLDTTNIPVHLTKQEKTIDDLCEKLQKMVLSNTPEEKTEKSPPSKSQNQNIHTLFDDLSDQSMLVLFRIEVENHSRVLEKGMLDIENNQTPEKIEPLMRAAHSIKGAARIVNLNLEVSLAHAMEDVLLRTQHSELTLSSSDIDVLLRSNDIFLHLSSLSLSEISGWLVEQSEHIKKLTQSLMDIIEGKPVDPTKITAFQPQAESLDMKQRLQREDSSVRVLAENLNCIIGLAGECLVQTKSSKPFSTSLLQMKNSSMILMSTLESLLHFSQTESISEEMHIKITDSLKTLNQISESLTQHIEDYERFSRHFEYLADKLHCEVVSTRMRPFSDGIRGFPRMVRDLAKNLNKKVTFKILGEHTRVDRDILEKMESPLTHLLQNAVDHGLETPEERKAMGKPVKGKLVLEARHIYGMLSITITDDGRGIDTKKILQKVIQSGHVSTDVAENMSDSEIIDFLFLPSFSTAEKLTEVSGRGIGLDVVSSMVQEVGGSVRVDSHPGHGTAFHLHLPLTLSVLRTLLVNINGEPYALPLIRIDHVLEIPQKDIHVLEDHQFCTFENEHVGIIKAQQVLQLPDSNKTSPQLHIVLISDRLNRYGLVVDRFLGEREMVVSPLDQRIGKIPCISSGSIMEDGSPVLIMDIDELVRSIDNLLTHGRLDKVSSGKKISYKPKKRILVVDDSLTVRQVECKLLENRGYEVETAVDGMDGLITTLNNTFDLIISDVDMPRMNGIEFVKRIKNDPKLKELPVMIISYKDREEDKIKGLKAGANYYLTKASFHDETLINAVRDLIGDP